MPKILLDKEENYDSISKWLNANLGVPFKANSKKIPNGGENRGIYFWFMKPNTYEKLSAKDIQVSAVDPLYTKKINGQDYHLVYIGTAGVIKKGENTLNKRLKWHLDDKHTPGNICHGTLSTLRQTIGAALSDDLILPQTESDVNELFANDFYISILPYTEIQNSIAQIDNDEFHLISILKPLLNIKNNPNARLSSAPNSTRTLKVRRGLIIKKTRIRLECNKGAEMNPEKANSNPSNLPPSTAFNNYELIFDHNGCQEFTVSQDQSILVVVSGIDGLPTGRCEISIYNSSNPNEKVYVSKKHGGKRVTGDKETNIYGFFRNPDTTIQNLPRWKVIQQEMKERNIEEITVRVSTNVFVENKDITNKKMEKTQKSAAENNNKKVKSKIKNPRSIAEIKSELIGVEKGNFNLVLTCAASKHKKTPILNYQGVKRLFRAHSNIASNEFSPFDNIPNQMPQISWLNYIENNQANLPLRPAKSIYTPSAPFVNIYQDLANKYQERFFIASAGWGIVKNEYKLPLYNITFSNAKDIPANAIRNKKGPFNADINHLLKAKKDFVIFLGGADYVQQFLALTIDIPNENKIIFHWGDSVFNTKFKCKKDDQIVNLKLMEIGVKLIRYPNGNNRTWYYHAAEMLMKIF